MNNLTAGNAFIQQGHALSPQSDTFSHTHPDAVSAARTSTPQAQSQAKRVASSNGHAAASSSTPRRPKNAFDLYCTEKRGVVIADGTIDVERALAGGWQSLSSQEKDEWQHRYEELKKNASSEETLPAQVNVDTDRGTPTPVPASSRPLEDEDVEMSEAHSPTGEADAAGAGFTAVNRG